MILKNCLALSLSLDSQKQVQDVSEDKQKHQVNNRKRGKDFKISSKARDLKNQENCSQVNCTFALIDPKVDICVAKKFFKDFVSLNSKNKETEEETNKQDNTCNEVIGETFELFNSILRLELSGFLSPNWILISGRNKDLQVTKTCLLNGIAKCPPGYNVKLIGDIKSARVEYFASRSKFSSSQEEEEEEERDTTCKKTTTSADNASDKMHKTNHNNNNDNDKIISFKKNNNSTSKKYFVNNNKLVSLANDLLICIKILSNNGKKEVRLNKLLEHLNEKKLHFFGDTCFPQIQLIDEAINHLIRNGKISSRQMSANETQIALIQNSLAKNRDSISILNSVFVDALMLPTNNNNNNNTEEFDYDNINKITKTDTFDSRTEKQKQSATLDSGIMSIRSSSRTPTALSSSQGSTFQQRDNHKQLINNSICNKQQQQTSKLNKFSSLIRSKSMRIVSSSTSPSSSTSSSSSSYNSKRFSIRRQTNDENQAKTIDYLRPNNKYFDETYDNIVTTQQRQDDNCYNCNLSKFQNTNSLTKSKKLAMFLRRIFRRTNEQTYSDEFVRNERQSRSSCRKFDKTEHEKNEYDAPTTQRIVEQFILSPSYVSSPSTNSASSSSSTNDSLIESLSNRVLPTRNINAINNIKSTTTIATNIKTKNEPTYLVNTNKTKTVQNCSSFNDRLTAAPSHFEQQTTTGAIVQQAKLHLPQTQTIDRLTSKRRQLRRSESLSSRVSAESCTTTISQQLRRHLDDVYEKQRKCTSNNRRDKEFLDSIQVFRHASRHALQASRSSSRSHSSRVCGNGANSNCAAGACASSHSSSASSHLSGSENCQTESTGGSLRDDLSPPMAPNDFDLSAAAALQQCHQHQQQVHNYNACNSNNSPHTGQCFAHNQRPHHYLLPPISLQDRQQPLAPMFECYICAATAAAAAAAAACECWTRNVHLSCCPSNYCASLDEHLLHLPPPPPPLPPPLLTAQSPPWFGSSHGGNGGYLGHHGAIQDHCHQQTAAALPQQTTTAAVLDEQQRESSCKTSVNRQQQSTTIDLKIQIGNMQLNGNGNGNDQHHHHQQIKLCASNTSIHSAVTTKQPQLTTTNNNNNNNNNTDTLLPTNKQQVACNADQQTTSDDSLANCVSPHDSLA